jgi:Ser/Thr protein kinase RdoA (MazF antagonist)
MATTTLWHAAARRINSATGISLHMPQRLGTPRDNRVIWLVQTPLGAVTVKALTNPFAAEKIAWLDAAVAALAMRGYPVPPIMWKGRLDERWFLVVQSWVPGQPLSKLDSAELDQLLDLVELQANLDGGPGGWNVSEWIANVVFDEWAGWWDAAHAAAPDLAVRLRAFAEPARDIQLPSHDLVHHDFSLTNILFEDGVVRGIVDWDDAGRGCRALDVTTLLFEWHRLRIGGSDVPLDGGECLAGRIVDIAGVQGLSSMVSYGAVARLALTSQRGEQAEYAVWSSVVAAILDSLGF